MKANELMIGDWVNLVRVEHEVEKSDNVITHLGYNREVKPIQITSIGSLGVHYDIPTFGPVYASKDEIEPIPLTKEILKKNGFHEIHKDAFEETRTHMYVLVGYDEGFVVCGSDEYGYYLGVDIDSYPVFVGCYRVSDNRYTKGTLYPKNNLMYVHQLQNILKLFGVEKEIVL